jgi:hypothetical protein
MTKSEKNIMRQFRQYRVGANEMLFFNVSVSNSHAPDFQSAMRSLIRNGLVVEERRRHAYSLTSDGYAASLSA